MGCISSKKEKTVNVSSFDASSITINNLQEDEYDRIRRTLTNRHLIVDDSESNRKALGAKLNRYAKCDYSECANGIEFLNDIQNKYMIEATSAVNPLDLMNLKVEKNYINDNYDIVWMDIKMPKLDGLNAVSVARNMGYKGIIICVTGNVEAMGYENSCEAGMDDFISKPVQTTELLIKIRTHLNINYI